MFPESSGSSPCMTMIGQIWAVVPPLKHSVARAWGALDLVITPVMGESGLGGSQPIRPDGQCSQGKHNRHLLRQLTQQ